MDGDWDFYFLRVDGQPASIYLDLSFARLAPLKSHSYLGYIRVAMKQPRQDGLSSDQEFESLMSLEDRLVSSITGAASTKYVGRNTSGGNRDFYFYATNAEQFHTAAGSAIKAFSSYQAEIGTRPDPDWETYLNFLHPSELDLQRILNRRVRQQLERSGDNANAVRNIDHLVYLPDRASQLLLRERLENMGFNIDHAAIEINSAGTFSIAFSRADRPADMDLVVEQILTASADLGGDYDGWGCSVTN